MSEQRRFYPDPDRESVSKDQDAEIPVDGREEIRRLHEEVKPLKRAVLESLRSQGFQGRIPSSIELAALRERTPDQLSELQGSVSAFVEADRRMYDRIQEIAAERDAGERKEKPYLFSGPDANEMRRILSLAEQLAEIEGQSLQQVAVKQFETLLDEHSAHMSERPAKLLQALMDAGLVDLAREWKNRFLEKLVDYMRFNLERIKGFENPDAVRKYDEEGIFPADLLKEDAYFTPNQEINALRELEL